MNRLHPGDRGGRRGRLARRALAAALYVVAAALGLGSAYVTLRRGASFGTAVGPWRVSLLAGGAEADAYTRARVALGGLLALNRGETLYYVAEVDSTGEPLRTRCSYRVQGVAPAARWWSITAYADDFFLIPNDEKRYSVDGARAAPDAQGRFAFVTGASRPAVAAAVPWVPTPGDRGLLLTLRLYQPASAVAQDPQRLALPLIERLGACP